MRDGAVPDGWRLATLGELATIVMGQSPPSSRVNEDGEGLPFIQGNAEFGFRHPRPLKWCAGAPKEAATGDVLVSVRAPVGELNLANRDLAIGRGLAAVRFQNADASFGWYALHVAIPRVMRLSQGSTFLAIGGTQLRTLPVLLPPPAEQRKIAQVLSSVDDAIETTEAVIDQVRRSKQAFVQELLSHGLSGRHTRFKQTEVGEIPEDWDVVRLGAVAEVASGFALGPSRRPGNNARPYLTVANVHPGKILLSEMRYMEVSLSEYEARKLAVGDILMVEGHAQLSELGRAAIVPPAFEGFTFQNHLFRVRTVTSRCDPAFLCAYVNGLHGRAYFRSFGGTTSGLNTVSTTNIRGMPLPLPSIDEQRHIARALTAIEQRAESERVDLELLRNVKAALMYVLLTGQVRVRAKSVTVAAGESPR